MKYNRLTWRNLIFVGLIVVHYASDADLSQAQSQGVRRELPTDAGAILEMNQRYVEDRALSEITVEVRGDRSREVVKIISAPGGRRRIKQEYRRTSQTEPFSLTRERDLFRDFATSDVRSFSAPSLMVLPLITPCDTHGAGAAYGPWSGDLELLPLGNLLWLIPVRVNESITLTDYIDRVATEFQDLGGEIFHEQECFRWRFRHKDSTMLNGGDPVVDLWLSREYPGVIMRFRIATEFQTPRGLLHAGRDIQVESLRKLETGLAVPAKTLHYAFETQSQDSADSQTLISVAELIDFNLDVFENEEFMDPLLGFKYPRYLPVKIRDVDLTDEFAAAKETVIYGDSEAQVILRTTEGTQWIRNWCVENGFSVSTGHPHLTDASVHQPPAVDMPKVSNLTNESENRNGFPTAIAGGFVVVGLIFFGWYWRRTILRR